MTQTAKLTASDGAASDQFGTSVAIGGDTVVIGAWQDDIGSNGDQGSAYVFVKPDGGWADMTQTAKLAASDGAAIDQFGFSVAIGGDTIVVGAFADDSYKGSAYVFVKPVGGWADMTQTAKLTASDGAATDLFGASMAISGDTIVVGAYADDIGSNGDQGSAYVFVKPGGGWADMTQTAKLTASDGAAFDYFGWSVAISGDTIVVGAYGAASSNGSAYVFVKPDGGWADMTQTAKLTASDGAASGSLGRSVAISGDTIVGGAYGADSYKGSAYVFSDILATPTPTYTPPNTPSNTPNVTPPRTPRPTRTPPPTHTRPPPRTRTPMVTRPPTITPTPTPTHMHPPPRTRTPMVTRTPSPTRTPTP